MSAITGFFIAAGAVSAIIFAMMLRADRLRDRRRAYADSSASDTGGTSSSINDSFNLLNWFRQQFVVIPRRLLHFVLIVFQQWR